MKGQQRCCRIILSLVLIAGLSGCAVEQGKVYYKDGKTYGVTSGYTWRGQWWDYYERGSSYASGAYWEDARHDFQAAVQQRPQDQRSARTYGLHLLDYFPHRELGVVYYYLGRYQDAIQELTTSLSTVDTAKAKFYLNKARRSLLQQAGGDTAVPRIALQSPPDGLLTNQVTLAVTGQVEDDMAVAALSIHGRAQFIELAEPRLPFHQEIALHDGANTIAMVAQDLLGGETRQHVTVYLDRRGPLVSIVRAEVVGTFPQRRVLLEGFVADQSHIRRFEVADKPISLATAPGSSQYGGEFHQDLVLAQDTQLLSFEAEDAAGNVTRGDITLTAALAGRPQNRQGTLEPFSGSRWASIETATIMADAPSIYGVPQRVAQATAPALPVIEVRSVADQEVIYEDTLYVDGHVSSPNAITAFAINGASRLPRQTQQLFFNENISLQPGENRITLEAMDAAGNTTQRPLIVTHELPATQQLSSRLRVILLPFEKKGATSVMGEDVGTQLFDVFIKQRRFDFVERQKLAAVLQELKLSQTDLVDPKTAQTIGKVVAADGMLIGTVTETAPASQTTLPSLEVIVRFVDMETTAVLASVDVYGEAIMTLPALRQLMDGLAWKLQRHFPLVEGFVLAVEDKKLLTDLAASQGVKQFMKLIIFRPGQEIKHPKTGRLLKRPPTIMGEARLTAVSQDTSEATPLTSELMEKVQELDMVITK